MGGVDESDRVGGGHDRGAVTEYRVLGPLDVIVDGRRVNAGGPKQRAVIAVLVAAAGQPVSVDRLLHAMYGDDASPGNRASLQTYVSNLRNVLGNVIVRQRDGYLLDITEATIDAVEFEGLYRSCRDLEAAADVGTRLHEALAMWRSHPYADVEAHGVLDGEITRLNELRVAALEARITADLRAGRHGEVVAELNALTVEHPYREQLCAAHMLALYRSGRQAEALRAFARTRQLLVEDLGIDPSPELRDLERKILVQDRDLVFVAGPQVLRRAVLVADIDDAGWDGPDERDGTFARREAALAAAAERAGGIKLAPRGSAGYAVFAEPIHAVRAASSVVSERVSVVIDVGDLELGDGEPVGAPLARAARIVAVAHPGQVLLSAAAHDALTEAGEAGWAAAALGRFDILGLDPGAHLYQLVGNGFVADFPALRIDRLPPPVPSGRERSVPGYELRALIGGSPLGEVHRAYQPSVGREVAVRIFGPGTVGHPQFVRRFETALQRVARVEHPCIVPLLDYWREPNRAVMVSRLMTGGHLGQRIPPGGLRGAEASTILEAVASGVAYAHRLGVVHGRIRPESVLFDDDGNPFVADFGVDEICAGVVTFASTAVDAPERLGDALATPAADIYSLGVLIHRLVVGSPPPPDGPLSVIEGRVGQIVTRATDPEPLRRHASVNELTDELTAAFAPAAEAASAFVPTRNPYRGLQPFEEADADVFHGRDRALAEMIAVLGQEHLLVVIGPSGIGKSSAVKAGLVPALRRGAVAGSELWHVTEMVPGREPFQQLAAALDRVATVANPDVVGSLMAEPRALDDVVRGLVPPGSTVLVVVDQLEELFPQTVDEHDRRAFLEMIVELAERPAASVRIVATLRADYLDRPLGYAGFGDILHGRTIALGALHADELADAVRLPASAVGVTVEPALVQRIVTDAEHQPGALPLLQHTMAELFDRRHTNTITLAEYTETGGLAGSIGRRAETIFASLDDAARESARQVFLRLVSVQDDGADARRRVRRTELDQSVVAADSLDAVLAAYGRHRLLTFDRDPASRSPTVELAHEAVLTEWARYRSWVGDARDDLITRRRLETATHEWLNAGSDASYLYGGGRLELAESWAATSGFQITDDEHRFLDASRHKADRDRIRRTKRRRLIAGLLVTALIVTSVLASVALVQRRDAERQADRADRAGTLAEARRLGTQALVVDDYDQALLLAVEGRHLDDSRETRANLLGTIQRSPAATAVIRSESDAFIDLGLTPDGDTLLVSGFGGPDGLSKYNVATRQREASLPGPGTRVSSAVSPDGRHAVVTSFTGSPSSGRTFELHIVDVATFDVIDTLPGLLEAPPTRLSFSPDGRYIAAVTDSDLSGAGLFEAVALVWDVAKGGEPIVQYPFSAANFRRDTAFLPDSKRIVVAGADGTAVVDIASGEEVGRIDGAYPPIAVSPDGATLAAATDLDQGLVVGLFDFPTGDHTAVLAGHRERLVRLAFSHDGAKLASGADDQLVTVWDVAGGQRTVFEGHSAAVNAVAFSPDGSRLWSAGDDRAIFAWDLRRADTLVHRASAGVTDDPTLQFIAQGMVIGPDGRDVAFPSTDQIPFQIREVVTGALSEPSAIEDGWFTSFSPDGDRYLTVGENGTLRVWDRDTGTVLAESEEAGISNFHEGTAVFTPDGRFVVALRFEDGGGLDNDSLVVMDASTLAPVDGEPVPIESSGRMVGVTPDSRHAVVVASNSDPGQPGTSVLLVDLETRRVVRSTPVEQNGQPFAGARNNTVAPDGRTVGIGGFQGDVVIVDAVTGEVSPPLHAHDDFVESVTFAPDYTSFVTTGRDGAIKLWDAITQDLLGSVSPLGPNHRVRASFLGADRVLIVYDTGEVLEWDPRPQAWEAHACRVAGRNLTKAEWAELFPGQAYRRTCPDFAAGP